MNLLRFFFSFVRCLVNCRIPQVPLVLYSLVFDRLYNDEYVVCTHIHDCKLIEFFFRLFFTAIALVCERGYIDDRRVWVRAAQCNTNKNNIIITTDVVQAAADAKEINHGVSIIAQRALSSMVRTCARTASRPRHSARPSSELLHERWASAAIHR